MIIRLTQKLAKKIDALPLNSLPLHDNPFADWSTNLFTVRRFQYIMMSNTTSLYSIVTPGRGISDIGKFIREMRFSLRYTLRADGLSLFWDRLIEAETGHVQFAKSLNRSVTGSMNDMIFCAKGYIEDDLSMFEVSARVNQMPMRILEYDPRSAFQSQTPG